MRVHHCEHTLQCLAAEEWATLCRPSIPVPAIFGRARRNLAVNQGTIVVPAKRPASKVAAAEPDALSLRDREILKDIIYTHILSGEPVSSRAVSKHSQHSLSAASIRNIMADLEESGLLAQPHSSAGRVPTEAAYRLYVGGLMPMRKISNRERSYIEEYLLDASNDTDHLMGAATHLLSELSGQVGVRLPPSVG